jgi:hypothetical protein
MYKFLVENLLTEAYNFLAALQHFFGFRQQTQNFVATHKKLLDIDKQVLTIAFVATHNPPSPLVKHLLGETS